MVKADGLAMGSIRKRFYLVTQQRVFSIFEASEHEWDYVPWIVLVMEQEGLAVENRIR